MVVVSPGCYMTNFSSPVFNMIFTKLDDGSIVLALPVPSSTRVALIDAAPDYGAYVREALEAPLSPKKILASSEELTLDEIVKQFNEGASPRHAAQPSRRMTSLGFFLQSLAPTRSTSRSPQRTGSRSSESRVLRPVGNSTRCCNSSTSAAVRGLSFSSPLLSCGLPPSMHTPRRLRRRGSSALPGTPRRPRQLVERLCQAAEVGRPRLRARDFWRRLSRAVLAQISPYAVASPSSFDSSDMQPFTLWKSRSNLEQESTPAKRNDAHTRRAKTSWRSHCI